VSGVDVIPLSEARPRPGRRAALGVFDGVHLGHRAVIEGSDTAVTFDPHPAAVLRPGAAPKLLTRLERRAELIAELGVRELIVVPFTRELAALEGQRFVDEVLIERVGPSELSVGENFRFGRDRAAGVDLLAAQGAFDTRVAALVEVDGEPVSSTRIRELVAAGDVARAAGMLGDPFVFEGEVVAGDRRGRELGMPTANVVPDERLACPANGVYAATVGDYAAAVNIGVRPTFESDRGVLVEAHLIDFAGDLYGELLQIAFLERIRDELAFEAVDELVAQMHRDVEAARGAAATFLRR
jgi:riboflavin kinase / FMN adenylyltransferase